MSSKKVPKIVREIAAEYVVALNGGKVDPQPYLERCPKKWRKQLTEDMNIGKILHAANNLPFNDPTGTIAAQLGRD